MMSEKRWSWGMSFWCYETCDGQMDWNLAFVVVDEGSFAWVGEFKTAHERVIPFVEFEYDICLKCCLFDGNWNYLAWE